MKRRKANRQPDGTKSCLTCGKEIYMRDCFCSNACARKFYILEDVDREIAEQNAKRDRKAHLAATQ